jgi:Tat protein secretion system quality control protein TatD with DNase activity
MPSFFLDAHHHPINSDLGEVYVRFVDHNHATKKMHLLSEGLHPWRVSADREFNKKVFTAMVNNEHFRQKKIYAIGETGLDFFWANKNHIPMECMLEVFEWHLDYALSNSLPVVVHMVRGPDKTLEVIKNFPKLKFFFHDFRSPEKFVKDFLKFDALFSFGTSLFYPQAFEKGHHVIKLIPPEKVFFESDDSTELSVIQMVKAYSGMTGISVEDLSFLMNRTFQKFFLINNDFFEF